MSFLVNQQLSFGSGFKVEVAASPPFFIGAMSSRFVLAVGFHPCFSSFFIHCCIQ